MPQQQQEWQKLYQHRQQERLFIAPSYSSQQLTSTLFSSQVIIYNFEPTSSLCLIEHHLCFPLDLRLSATVSSRYFFDTISEISSRYKAETGHRSLTQLVSDTSAGWRCGLWPFVKLISYIVSRTPTDNMNLFGYPASTNSQRAIWNSIYSQSEQLRVPRSSNMQSSRSHANLQDLPAGFENLNLDSRTATSTPAARAKTGMPIHGPEE